MMFLELARAVGVAAQDPADLALRIPAMPGLNRSDELEKHGCLGSSASSKIAIASARSRRRACR